MGRVSEELKSLKKIEEDKLKALSGAEKRLAKHKIKKARKTPVYPHLDRDYYWLKVEAPNAAPRGWVMALGTIKISKSDIKFYLENTTSYPGRASQKQIRGFQYYLYRGERPDPKWGELCP
jgi:hypothetical protein